MSKFKGYIIDKINNQIDDQIGFLLKQFLKEESLNYDPNHKTRPIIFKNGKFLGGYSELEKDLV